MKVRIIQGKSRYPSTGDYFKMIAKDIGVETEFIGKADLALYFNEGLEMAANHHVAYERDADRTILVQSPYPKFYTQYGSWPDDRVILHATDPEIFKRTQEPEHDIVFVGRDYGGERSEFFQALIDSGLDIKVYGDGYNTQDYVDLLNTGRILLNYSERGEINRRVFEIMAIGCCVTDRAEHIEEVGQEGKHLFSFDKNDISKTITLLRKLSQNKKLTDKVAKASRQHIINKHTYKHRFEELIKKGTK